MNNQLNLINIRTNYIKTIINNKTGRKISLMTKKIIRSNKQSIKIYKVPMKKY